MKNTFFLLLFFILFIAVSVALQSCTKDIQQQQIAQPQNDVSNATTADLPGRTLAANCFQCHGTNGHGTGEMALAGMSASEIVNEMNDMKQKDPGANIMNVHALAYTDQEIQLIADFFSKQ